MTPAFYLAVKRWRNARMKADATSTGSMTRAEYEALALRVEREEPSQDLDCAVMVAARGKPLYPLGTAAYGSPIPPRYTTSLDAAASLCPAGWIAADIIQTPTDWQCSLWREDETMVHGNARTEPQARTAAALRARAMEASDD